MTDIMHKLFGHKFRPRFDITPPSPEILQEYNAGLRETNRQSFDVVQRYEPQTLATTTYVCDICVRCGEVKLR